MKPKVRLQKPGSSTVKTLFAIHGWSGVLVGLLLYAVIVTGVVAVFAEEIGHWSSPIANRPVTALPVGLDAGLRQVAKTIEPRFLDEVSISNSTGKRIRAFFHTHVKQDNGNSVNEGVEVDLDPTTWQVLDRREGTGLEVREQNVPSTLSRFLVDLHVRLYLPDPWGLLLTGILGLAMMVAAVTGFIIHRHLLRELFLLRLSQKNPLLTAHDRHKLAGAWNLLFAFVLAFTGSFFSFAGSFGLPAMAMVAFGGDQERMIESVIGMPQASDDTPVPLANLDDLLADARSRADQAELGFLGIQRWGRADALVTVNTKAAAGSLSGRTFVYNGASGEFQREKPFIGLQPSAGNTLVSLMGPLHFGDFAGVPSKAIWFGLGIASAYVVLSGLLLWTDRRQPHWQPLGRLTVWMGYGLPLCLTATAWGFFSAAWFALDELNAVKLAFLGAILVVSLVSLVTSNLDTLRVRLLMGNTVLLALAPVLRWCSGGMGWRTALSSGWLEVFAVDLLLFGGSALCVFVLRRRYQVAQASLQPALNH